MHERTQRAIAQLMFVFCCAVPTLITLLCILVTWTPWYHNRALRAMEAGLLRDTGMVVEITDFDRATPSTLQLHQLRVVHPETGREVATVRQVEWVTRGDEVSILLHQPELQSSELASVWQMIHDRFLCRPEQTSLPVQVVGNDLTIHSRTGAMPLRDVRAWIQPRGETVEATIECLLANSASNSPFNITMRRDRGGDMPATQVMLDSGGTPLPCSALAEYLQPMESLGGDATFSGTMRWQIPSDHRWWIDLSGSRFEDISLDRLFDRQSHRLSGTASVQFERCRIEPSNRRSDIVGSFRAREGVVGRRLLLSVNQHLGFHVNIPEGMIDDRGDVPYDRIAIGFQVINTQLTLDGICQSERGYEGFPPGVVLSLDLQPLVYSHDQTLDSVKLITALAPAHSVAVPLSSQTSPLISVLIPPSRPLPSDERFPPRIRSADNYRGGPTIIGPPR